MELIEKFIDLGRIGELIKGIESPRPFEPLRAGKRWFEPSS